MCRHIDYHDHPEVTTAGAVTLRNVLKWLSICFDPGFREVHACNTLGLTPRAIPLFKLVPSVTAAPCASEVWNKILLSRTTEEIYEIRYFPKTYHGELIAEYDYNCFLPSWENSLCDFRLVFETVLHPCNFSFSTSWNMSKVLNARHDDNTNNIGIVTMYGHMYDIRIYDKSAYAIRLIINSRLLCMLRHHLLCRSSVWPHLKYLICTWCHTRFKWTIVAENAP